MDLAGLRAIKAVSETGSVSRAAESLNCVQSNVTARVKKLEEELGVPLFHRMSRGMTPTPAGRVLADYADRILRLMGQARDAVADAAGRGGQLTVGTMETTAAVRLPPVLARFHAAHPDVELTLVSGRTGTLLTEVLAGRLDGAFVAGAIDHPELTGEPVFEEELVLVEPAGGLTSRGSRNTLIGFGRTCTYRAMAETIMREAGRLPYKVMEFGALDAILGCVAAGMGVTVLPRTVVARDPWRSLVAVREIDPRFAHVPTYFVRRADAVETLSLRALRAAVSEDRAMARVAEDSGMAPPTTRRTGLNGREAAC